MRAVDEKFRKLEPIDAVADLLWQLYLSGDAVERQRTEELLDILLHQQVNKDFRHRILLDPGHSADCTGQYELGTVIYPDRNYSAFGLRENEWIRHLLITGMTGTGKTNLCFQILGQFQKHGKPFLVFDWKKSYRDLLQLPAFSSVGVYTIGSSVRPFLFKPLTGTSTRRFVTPT